MTALSDVTHSDVYVSEDAERERKGLPSQYAIAILLRGEMSIRS